MSRQDEELMWWRIRKGFDTVANVRHDLKRLEGEVRVMEGGQYWKDHKMETVPLFDPEYLQALGDAIRGVHGALDAMEDDVRRRDAMATHHNLLAREYKVRG